MSDTTELWHAAQAHAERQDWTRAASLFQRIVELAPRDAAALLQLSYIASLQGQYRAARAYALRAHAARPTNPAAMIELMSRLRTFNEAVAFRECTSRLPAKHSLDIPTLISVAAQLSYFNQQEEALAFLDEAARADPGYPPTLAARGQVLMYMGRFAEARADLERCIARGPRISQAWWLLARLGVADRRASRIGALRALLNESGRKPDDVALLGFALHLELDDDGEYAGAWEALSLACAAKRSRIQYRARDTELLVESLISTPAGSPMPDDGEHDAEPCPVFVVGMHRSGTTLLEEMLDRHPSVRGLGELYDFTHQMRFVTDHHCRGVIDRAIVERAGSIDLAQVGRKYVEGVRWRLAGEARFVDKLPSNFLQLGFICRALPRARILHMKRDPMETCFSSLRELYSDACPYSYDQEELAHFHGQYARLMAHWHRTMPGRIMDVEYRDLVGASEATLRTIAGFCGIPFDSAMLERDPRMQRGVATASAVQVRRSPSLPTRPKWAPYEAWLQPLQAGLARPLAR